MRIITTLCAAAALGCAAQAGAAVTVSTGAYSTPITYDFDPSGTSKVTGGQIVTGTNPYNYEAPGLTSTGYYLSSSPASTAVLSLSDFAAGITSFSFVWGTVDNYNTISFLDRVGNTIASVTGAALGTPALTPQFVTFSFTGTDQGVGSVQFASTSNAFEIDNIAIAPVPEPATWAMMILGFGVVGFAMRRRRGVATTVRFA